MDWREITAEEFDAIPKTAKTPAPSEGDPVMERLEAGTPVRIPVADAAEQKKKRLSVGRRAAMRGFEVEICYEAGAMAVRRGADRGKLRAGRLPKLVAETAQGLVDRAYPLVFGDAVGMDEGLVYSAVDSEEVDVISAFATDGRIPALGLVLLEDDRGFFPPYFAAPVVRQDVLDEDPAIADVLNKMAGKIDNATMADLNFQVDDGGEEAEDVARTFLEGLGLIGQG